MWFVVVVTCLFESFDLFVTCRLYYGCLSYVLGNIEEGMFYFIRGLWDNFKDGCV